MTNQDLAAGVAIYNDLIAFGDHEAMYKLGKRLLVGDGVARNVSRGEEMLGFLASVNHPDAQAVYGDHLIRGLYIDQDIKTGKKLLHKGCHAGSALAMLLMADNFRTGEYWPANELKARDWEGRVGLAVPADARQEARDHLSRFRRAE